MAKRDAQGLIVCTEYPLKYPTHGLKQLFNEGWQFTGLRTHNKKTCVFTLSRKFPYQKVLK